MKRKSPKDIFERSKVKKMNPSQQQKTPITILQEICAKKIPQNLPVYDDLKEAPEDCLEKEFPFYSRCHALGLTSLGWGMTKKIAKHTAAEILLKKYMRNYDEDDEAMDYSDEEGAEMHGDYITRLMDFCVMKNFFKPEFECINSYGPSHEPVFTFQCRLSSIKKNADAENKKLAKQLSAKKMLDEIMVSYPDLEKKIALVDETNAISEMTRKKVTSYRELKKLNQVEKMGTLIKDRHEFFTKQEESFVTALKEILNSNELSQEDKYKKLLDELKTMWQYTIEDFVGFKKFELLIDFENFTCVILASDEQRLRKEVLEYFYQMLGVKTAPEVAQIKVSDNEVMLIPF